MALVTFDHLTYTYPTAQQPALTDICLKINEGEFVTLIGANGAGKSTLCYTAAGFIPHFFKGELQGTVEVASVNTLASSLPKSVETVGLVFQNPFSQISGAKFTVYEEIAFGLENRGVAREEMPERIEQVMTLTGIRDLSDRSPYSLSGGQQQRVALASILVLRPKVLVLDEPTSQLDPIGSREVLAAIRRLTETGMTVLMAEHKVEWIAAFSDRVIALETGRIIAEGKSGDVLSDPALLDHGVGLSRYTRVARAAAVQGLWPTGLRLPVSLEEAEEGFRTAQERIAHDHPC
jgi:energy-coupling factor transport system ATP-binding protein